MKTKLVVFLLLLSSFAKATQLDSKSLFIGVGLGLGIYTTRTVIAKPVAKATTAAIKKTSHAVVHAVTLGKK